MGGGLWFSGLLKDHPRRVLVALGAGLSVALVSKSVFGTAPEVVPTRTSLGADDEQRRGLKAHSSAAAAKARTQQPKAETVLLDLSSESGFEALEAALLQALSRHGATAMTDWTPSREQHRLKRPQCHPSGLTPHRSWQTRRTSSRSSASQPSGRVSIRQCRADTP